MSSKAEVGGEYTFQGNFILVRVIRVTPTKVRYTDGTGFFGKTVPRKEFERVAIRLIRHKRRNEL